jgi:hypothetical protein
LRGGASFLIHFPDLEIPKLHKEDSNIAREKLSLNHHLVMAIDQSQYRTHETILSWKDCHSFAKSV